MTKRSTNFLEVVVTARPSWARVKSFVNQYVSQLGPERIRLSIAGAALSRNFGDITRQIPKGVKFSTHPTLLDSDTLTSISLSASNLISSLSRHWNDSPPNAVMVIADRSETLGVAVASSLCQIPLIHLQGGEVSGSIDNKIRDANTKLADLHLTTNSLSKDRLLSLGERPSLIHIIGCPSIDLVVETLAKESGFRVSDVPGVGADIDNGDTFGIVMFHPDTLNETENMFWLGKIIEFVETSSHKWIWFWPNSDHGNTLISKELRRQRERGKLSNVRFVINLPPEDFILLANLSLAIVGNSSFGIREASFLGIPALNLGKRQSGRQVSKNVISIDEQANSDRMSEVYGVERSDVGVDTLYGDGTAGFLATQILAKWEPKLK